MAQDSWAMERAAAQSLRLALLSAADVEQAYQLAQDISDGVNDSLNARSDRLELTAATSILARAIAARALLIVAGDWWGDLLGPDARPRCRSALRSFIDQAPPGYADHSHIDPEIVQ